MSARDTILAFPQTKRALRHYRSGMDAAGFLSLLLLERDGESLPDNVQRFDEPQGLERPERSGALLLALLIWDTLPKVQRARVKQLVRVMAYEKGPDRHAVQLNNALNGRF